MSRGLGLSAFDPARTAPPPPRQRRKLLRSEVPSADECVPHTSRLRGHVRESARHLGCGFATAPRLPALSLRLRLPLARSAPADARLRFSGAGLPVPPRFQDLSIPSARQGGGASLVDFCNHCFSDPRAQPSNRPIPADSISSIDVVFSRAGRTRALTKAETLADLSRLSPGSCHRFRGRSLCFRRENQRCRRASGAFARSSR